MKDIDPDKGIVAILVDRHIVEEPGTIDIIQDTYLDLVEETDSYTKVLYSTNAHHDANVNERTSKDKFKLNVWRNHNDHKAASLEFPRAGFKVSAFGPITRLYNLIGDALLNEGLIDPTENGTKVTFHKNELVEAIAMNSPMTEGEIEEMLDSIAIRYGEEEGA